MLNRSERIACAPFRRAAAAAAIAASLVASGCGRQAAARIAERALESHRKATGARPMPESGSIRIRLSPAVPDAAGTSGTCEIEWEGLRYRETTTSAGVAVVRGIQGGKAFYIDEDGVTRVGSEPMLAELTTRSYFWRRGYLFADRERAKLSLGPADDATLSLVLRPRAGNALRLVFDRRTDALRAVESPRFRLEFESPTRFRDLSRMPVAAQIAWTGLPTRRLPDPVVGGWKGEFAGPPAEVPLAKEAAPAVVFDATLAGVPARIALDADTSGPIAISAALARRAGLAGTRDVFGRLLAAGVALGVGGFRLPSAHAEIRDPGASGIDASIGGALFRETVVEVDPEAGRLGLHDPEKFVPPEGYQRNVLDDDGDLPSAILYRSGRRLRLRAGTADASALTLPPSVAQELGLGDREVALPGLVWGTLRLPPVPARIASGRFDPAWGDDGALGWPLLSRFHVYVDMPHRWIYLKPAAAAQGVSRER